MPIELNANLTAGGNAIGGFLCPSDWRATPEVPGASSYRFNVGMLWASGAPGGGDYLFRPGAFVLFWHSRPQDFTDGLSGTVGLSERLLGSRSAPPKQPDRARDLWYMGVSGIVTATSADEVLNDCAALRGVPLDYQSDLGRFWDESSFTSGWYNHVAPPNAAIMDCTLGRKEGTGLSDTDFSDTALTARSAHPGGVNALMMDGSVRSIKSSIQLSVWRSLGTRSGGEVLDSSY